MASGFRTCLFFTKLECKTWKWSRKLLNFSTLFTLIFRFLIVLMEIFEKYHRFLGIPNTKNFPTLARLTENILDHLHLICLHKLLYSNHIIVHINNLHVGIPLIMRLYDQLLKVAERGKDPRSGTMRNYKIKQKRFW